MNCCCEALFPPAAAFLELFLTAPGTSSADTSVGRDSSVLSDLPCEGSTSLKLPRWSMVFLLFLRDAGLRTCLAGASSVEWKVLLMEPSDLSAWSEDSLLFSWLLEAVLLKPFTWMEASDPFRFSFPALLRSGFLNAASGTTGVPRSGMDSTLCSGVASTNADASVVPCISLFLGVV